LSSAATSARCRVGHAAARAVPRAFAAVPAKGISALFASHKMRLKTYLAAIPIFMNEVKGKSMLALSRDRGTRVTTV
jgi:hypothetical protein